MNQEKMIDHLFRHQFGKMVSILTRIFGLSNLETIEDAVQDTFSNALLAWRNGMPENPEAWLTSAAKNRTIDLFRQLKSEKERAQYFENGPAAMVIDELFLDDEVEDSQLRMIFTACHPKLDSRDQIAFALRTISGFSQKEIASALLTKNETIKKRLSRARSVIQEGAISFEIPQGKQLPERLSRVQEVLYLIFNEGFHSNKKEILVRHDLCGEALRLTKLLMSNSSTGTPSVHALFALMCFHSARLDSKVNEQGEIIDLKKQDRGQWHVPLMMLGDKAMMKAVETDHYSTYHYEAAIASEHLKAKSFELTDWDSVLMWYDRMEDDDPSPFNRLNMAVINIEKNDLTTAQTILEAIDPEELGQRAYLYYGCMAEYFKKTGDYAKARASLDKAIAGVTNEAEGKYLRKKRSAIPE